MGYLELNICSSMIVPSMTQKEIAVHLFSEVKNNRKRIVTKAKTVAKQMRRLGRKVHSYKQTVGSNTGLTIYIYGIDKEGVDYAVGCWYHSDRGYCWVSVMDNGVHFYLAHFFHRYAERFLKKQMSVQDAAKELYSRYLITAARKTEQRPDGKFKMQLAIQDGLARGVIDTANDVVVYNTCVSDLWPDQVSDIEDDRQLNDALQSMDWLQYKAFVEAITL